MLMQVSRYYQYFKGEHVGTGPGIEELMLRIVEHLAQWFGNPKILNVAMAMMSEVEKFSTREPHLEYEEVFVTQKRKVDIPLGFEHECHRHDKVNFSCPRVNIISTRARDGNCNLNDSSEELSIDIQEGDARPSVSIKHPTPIDKFRGLHVIAIQETAYNKSK